MFLLGLFTLICYIWTIISIIGIVILKIKNKI